MPRTSYHRGIYDESKPATDDATVILNNREMEVIRLLADGKQVKEIAAVQDGSLGGVKWVIAGLYRKLGVVNRVGLVRMAIRKGWVKA